MESLACSGSPHPLICDFHENPRKSMDSAKSQRFSKIGGKPIPIWLSRVTSPRTRKKYWKVNNNYFSSVPIGQNSPAESLARSGSPHPLICDFHENPWKSFDFAKFQWFSKIGGKSDPLWLSRITSPGIRKKYWKVIIICFSNVPIDQNSPAESLARSGSPHPKVLES